MDKRYAIIGIIVVTLSIAVYLSGSSKNIAERLNKLGIPGFESADSVDEGGYDDKVLDEIVTKLKNDGLHDNLTIIKSGGAGGSGGGGDGSGSCSSEPDSTTALSSIAGADYFIRAKVTETENVVDAESGETITYTYASIEEYEKITGTGISTNEEGSGVVVEPDLTEAEYLAVRAEIPDINPEQLLIISYANPGETPESGGSFRNFVVDYENGGLSVLC